MTSNHALLLIRKGPDITSFSSLSPVKRTIDRKAGHAGTLDKFAEGLMIVLTGAFTKLNPLLSDLDKRYVATIRFGEETETLDPEGAVIHSAPIPPLHLIERTIANQFIGSISQRPPVYSAVHIDGKRAHKLARAGKEVTMPYRDISIFSIDIVSWQEPELTIAVHCSKGTYIRSLARDIAIACGSRAHLRKLVRTDIGPYHLEDAVDPTDADALVRHAEGSVDRLMLIPGMGRIVVSDEAAHKLTYGNLPTKHGIVHTLIDAKDRYAAIFSSDGQLLAVVSLDDEGNPVSSIALPCVRKS